MYIITKPGEYANEYVLYENKTGLVMSAPDFWGKYRNLAKRFPSVLQAQALIRGEDGLIVEEF